ncbi:FAD-dependent monooxygenase [Mitsuaria sp. GD03876]|uniref:FAD-dependent monooxygenase n=1 Tax=Mitsuaria sp. GD03876 TaxID=2975399 RepID=UPI00244A00A6|nr:FAD-dependent monooxygenase [Mitsuaria sp. GD03876]MDH0867782.1 FAD-dependent monooxygenase [Mitsuaria sp. GD03876]
MQRIPVAVIGGSLVGLSAAVFLAARGVPAVVIEKHRGSSPHPRAIGYTEHTLEQFRAVGLGDRIPQVEPGLRLRRVSVESLTGAWSAESSWTPGEDAGTEPELSPCTGAAIAQDKLEPILRERAVELGARLMLGTELVSFHQTGEGVVLDLMERDTLRRFQVLAEYVIAADGARSPIRERLGIAREGVGAFGTMRSVMFRCAGADAVLDRGFQQFEIDQPGFRAFLTTYHDGRWVLMFNDDAERDEAELVRAIERALGQSRERMPFEIITTGRWEMAGRIATRYSEGRIFLAGDAAHQLPPTRGGFGANTGIDDVYTLAWKLQIVLSGRSRPALLDSHHEERRPIGWLRHQQTFARPDYAKRIAHPPKDVALIGNAAMELGQLHRSAAVIGAVDELPPAAHPDTWAGQPGVRAPHAWVKQGEATISTIDLFTCGFTLISEDAGWIEAVRAVEAVEATGSVAGIAGLTIHAVHVGHGVTFVEPGAFRDRFGVSGQGASLVRPDGIVAWRSDGPVDDRAATLIAVLRQVAALA